MKLFKFCIKYDLHEHKQLETLYEFVKKNGKEIDLHFNNDEFINYAIKNKMIGMRDILKKLGDDSNVPFNIPETKIFLSQFFNYFF